MTANPLSIRADATVKEAVAFLVDKAISGAPVIDTAGRPVGVLSQFDVVVHDREKAEYFVPEHDYIDCKAGAFRHLHEDFQLEKADRTQVRDIMTPVVFTVTAEALAGKVVEDMLARKIHRLFVVDGAGLLVGVITPLDILRRLRYHEPALA